LPLVGVEQEPAQVIPLRQAPVEPGLFVAHHGDMEERMEEDVQQGLQVDVLAGRRLLMALEAQEEVYQVVVVPRDLEAEYLVKQAP